jgi:large subunit ribosomal protein L22
MKRIRPAPQGRAFHYQRRMSHIIISVAEKKSVGAFAKAETLEAAAPAKKPAKKAAVKSAAKKAPAKKAAAKKKSA